MNGQRMKAYRVYDSASAEPLCTVVFADTPGQAKTYARQYSELFSCDWEIPAYVGLRAVREKALDAAFDGRRELDFYNDRDRRFYVQAGIACYEPEPEECAKCAAQDICKSKVDCDTVWLD